MSLKCYRVDSLTSEEAEKHIRSRGCQILSQELICSVQFFYQQIQPSDQIGNDPGIPVFTIVNLNDGEDFVITEVRDGIQISDLKVPSISIDIVKIDPMFLEKFRMFNLRNKATKRVQFAFSRFALKDTEILLREDAIILDSSLSSNEILHILSKPETKSLLAKVSACRPKPLDRSKQLALCIYVLAKSQERVFPVEKATSIPEVSDCLFAKDLLLV